MMIHSRNMNDLRSDVAANCKIFLTRCAAAGLNVLVTDTVRDKEYQEDCYRRGTAKTKTPSFHAVGVGLAFDIAKRGNTAAEMYNDLSFFASCAKIGKEMGFEWGGDWKSFPDRPHFQWSYYGKYASADILAGRYPPAMPLFEEGNDMDIRNTTVKIGSAEVSAKLIGGTTYVPLRALIDAIKDALAVTWTKEDGAGVEMK